jgi:uncharacterized protein YoxC
MSSRNSSISIGILAVAFVALAAFTVVKTSDANSKINDLESSTASLEQTTGGKDAEEIKALSGRVKKLEACIPEVENQINGLSIETEYGFIENNSQVSTYCSSVVYPQTNGQGE